MTKPQIAWIATEKATIEPCFLEMNDRGFEITYLQNATAAIESLTKGPKYSLVVINPEIGGSKDHSDDVIRRVMSIPRYQGQGRPHYEIGLRVIELAHGEDSVNRTTPIIAAGTYAPEGDALWPQARADCQRAGAVDYVELLAALSGGFDHFHDRLEKLARGN